MEGKFISVMSFCFIQGIVFRKESCKVFGCLVVFCLPCEGVCVLLFGFGNLYLVLTFHIISGPFVSQQLQIIQTLYFKSSEKENSHIIHIKFLWIPAPVSFFYSLMFRTESLPTNVSLELEESFHLKHKSGSHKRNIL